MTRALFVRWQHLAVHKKLMSIQQPRVTKFISNSFLTNERRHICLIDAGLPSKTEDHVCFRNHTRSLLFSPQWSFKLRNDVAHMLLSVDLQKSSFVGLLHFLLRIKNFITRHKQYNWVSSVLFLSALSEERYPGGGATADWRGILHDGKDVSCSPPWGRWSVKRRVQSNGAPMCSNKQAVREAS